MAALNPLRRWQRRGLTSSVTVLAASGLAWWLIHYAWGAGAGELPHPLEAWLMRLHGAAVLAALYFLGVIGAQHVSIGWRLARQRISGSSLLGGFALLALSGYALYYFTPESARPLIGNLHTAIGIASASLLAWHRRGVSR